MRAERGGAPAGAGAKKSTQELMLELRDRCRRERVVAAKNCAARRAGSLARSQRLLSRFSSSLDPTRSLPPAAMLSAPIVLQCGSCRRVISDSNQLVCAVEALDALVVDAVQGVQLGGAPSRAEAGAADAGSEHAPLVCTGCGATLGRSYAAAPPELAALVHAEDAPRYVLLRAALSSYLLGSIGEHHHAAKGLARPLAQYGDPDAPAANGGGGGGGAGADAGSGGGGGGGASSSRGWARSRPRARACARACRTSCASCSRSTSGCAASRRRAARRRGRMATRRRARRGSGRGK